VNIVILAAGKGKRMHSDLPKVLHPLAGRSLLAHVLDTARALSPTRLVVVVGHGADQVRQAVAADDVAFAVQAEQLGTGHAVMQALPLLDASQPTLVLYGDVPLTTVATLDGLVRAAGSDRFGILTADMEDPTGYGRIVRDASGAIQRIVEQKDATDTERTLREINTGIILCPTAHLRRWLAALRNDNAQGEYYLTDAVACAVAEDVPVVSSQPSALWETLGVNSKVQLAELERIHQRNIAQRLLEDGVTLLDPARIDVRGTLTCGRDVTIDVGCVFEGKVHIEDGAHIGPHCVIRESVIGAGVQVQAFCHIDQASIGAQGRIGPYARLRPGAELAEDVHIGNFVEVKNSQIAAHSKANHLAYVGDSTVGSRVNIGAGVITCNYDGVNKSRTVIEDDVFIGSDTQLVAPITVRRGAVIGAGTTLTREAPADQLTLSRAKQLTVPGWQKPVKKAK
jgi:bifunctional UDP-N-acetylglucosamine pyrophosphorylase/glucosamine-1-phosphate N-acetyltransferase